MRSWLLDVLFGPGPHHPDGCEPCAQGAHSRCTGRCVCTHWTHHTGAIR